MKREYLQSIAEPVDDSTRDEVRAICAKHRFHPLEYLLSAFRYQGERLVSEEISAVEKAALAASRIDIAMKILPYFFKPQQSKTGKRTVPQLIPSDQLSNEQLLSVLLDDEEQSVANGRKP